MNLNLHTTNVISNKEVVFENLKYDKTTTLRGLFDEVELYHADVSSYYPCSGCFAFNREFLPYLVHEGKVFYNVPYGDAFVIDFMETHSIEDSLIVAKTGMPQAGGADFLDPASLAEIILSTLQWMANAASITGFSLRDLGALLHTRMQSHKHPPQTDIDLVSSREAWSSSELAELMQVDREQAKHLLKGLGYIYNRRRQQYVKTKVTEEILRVVKETDVIVRK